MLKTFLFRKNFIFFYQKLFAFPTRPISISKLDPSLVEELTKKIEDDFVFKEVQLSNFAEVIDDEQTEKKINNIMNIYENMKYNMDLVPSTLLIKDVKKMLRCETNSDIRRFIKKLYKKEFDILLKKKLKNYEKTCMPKSSSNNKRVGLFDSDNNLIYGLWHNTLFTRITDAHKRFISDRLRYMDLFGQNVYIDLSFSEHLNYHLSVRVGNDIANTLYFNRIKMKEPFRITLCGVRYQDNLWRFMLEHFHDLIQSTPHTDKSYLALFGDKSKIIYFTNMETKKFLQYDPSCHYVMAGLSEKDINSDFLIPNIRKLGIKTQGLPFDQYLLWKSGSKRLPIMVKLKILNDLRDNKSWKETFMNNISEKQIKTKEEVQIEDMKRYSKMNATKASKKQIR